MLGLTASDAKAQCEYPIDQCPKQMPLDCDCEGVQTDFTICFAGTNYTASVWMCTQYASSSTLIDNPCTAGGGLDCNYGVNAITWIKRICVPQELKNQGLTAIYQAIIRGTDLCCNNILGVTLPNCGIGNTCTNLTNNNVYCHILALPKCLDKHYDAPFCYYACDNSCARHCFVERRYCRTSPVDCCSFQRTVCEGDNTACTGECNTYFDECCKLGGLPCCTP